MIVRRDFIKAGMVLGAASVAGPGLAAVRTFVPQLQLLADARFEGSANLVRSAQDFGIPFGADWRGGVDLPLAHSILRNTASLPLLGVTTYSDRLLFEGLARDMRRPFLLVSDERPVNNRISSASRGRSEGLQWDRLIPAGLHASLFALAEERGASIWLADGLTWRE